MSITTWIVLGVISLDRIEPKPGQSRVNSYWTSSFIRLGAVF